MYIIELPNGHNVTNTKPIHKQNQWTTSPRKRAGLANYYVVTHCEGFTNT